MGIRVCSFTGCWDGCLRLLKGLVVLLCLDVIFGIGLFFEWLIIWFLITVQYI